MSGRHRSTRESIDARIDRLGQTRSIGRVDSSRRGFARLQTQKTVGARTIARGLARVRECGARGCRREREKMSWTQLRARTRARCLNEAGFGAPHRQTAAQVHPSPPHVGRPDQSTDRLRTLESIGRSIGRSVQVSLSSCGRSASSRSTDRSVHTRPEAPLPGESAEHRNRARNYASFSSPSLPRSRPQICASVGRP